MPKSKQTSRRPARKSAEPLRTGPRIEEDRAAEAVTVAWTVSVTAVFMANLVTIAAHFYRLSNPDSKAAAAFEAIMLLSACVMGLASLALLPVVWRVRQTKPPQGFAVFAGSVAVAPLLVALVRLLR